MIANGRLVTVPCDMQVYCMLLALGRPVPSVLIASMLYRRRDTAQVQWGNLQKKRGLE